MVPRPSTRPQRKSQGMAGRPGHRRRRCRNERLRGSIDATNPVVQSPRMSARTPVHMSARTRARLRACPCMSARMSARTVRVSARMPVRAGVTGRWPGRSEPDAEIAQDDEDVVPDQRRLVRLELADHRRQHSLREPRRREAQLAERQPRVPAPQPMPHTPRASTSHGAAGVCVYEGERCGHLAGDVPRDMHMSHACVGMYMHTGMCMEMCIDSAGTCTAMCADMRMDMPAELGPELRP